MARTDNHKPHRAVRLYRLEKLQSLGAGANRMHFIDAQFAAANDRYLVPTLSSTDLDDPDPTERLRQTGKLMVTVNAH
jgi:hypothetical protein